MLNIWGAEEYYGEYGGTLYDWDQLCPRIAEAIRQVDASTPIPDVIIKHRARKRVWPSSRS